MPRAKGYLLTHTPELVEAILTDWRGGATYRQLAKKHDLTHCQIAGIVGRNKKRGEVSERAFFHPPPSEARERPTLPSGRPPRLGGGKMPTGRSVVRKHKMVTGGRFRECQFFAGEPGPDSWKCGQPTMAGTAYCELHYERCHIRKERPENA